MKKNGILTLLFACIPGAGQMYQGYMKRGLSLITMFCLFIILGSTTGLDALVVGCIVVYMYSFFDTLNLRAQLAAEKAPEDDYLVHFNWHDARMTQFMGESHKLVGWGLIALGAIVFYNNIIMRVLGDVMWRWGQDNPVFRAIYLMLDALPQKLDGDVLDMGCGYGVIGVAVGKNWPGCRVVMADVNERACGLAQKNAVHNGVMAEVLVSDGYERIMGTRFDWILQNPPIRAGKAVIYRMFADAAQCLKPGGTLWLVIRKQQGAPSAMTYLRTFFTHVEAVEKKGGYWIIRCAQPVRQDTEER